LIFRKFVGLVASLAAIAAAAAVCIVALSFALYAGLRDVIGPAWASAGVAGIVALIAVILALLLTRKARPKPAKGDSQNLTAQLINLARERPLVAVGVVGAAAAVVIKNPRILGAVIAGLFAPRPPPPGKR
jgi:Na+/melibiose symporter-like transporter